MEKLYHYTSFDTFLRIWASKRLKFGSVKNVNDIEEGRNSFNLSNYGPALIPLCHAYEDIRSSYKQISLNMDYDGGIKGYMSPIMWAHYGDKRKGVCIEFDYNKMNIPAHCFAEKVTYKDTIKKYYELPPGTETISDIKRYIIENRDNIFFTKLKCWEAENEFRIISNQDEFLEIDGAITAIYLTSCESDECIMAENLVKPYSIEVRYIHSLYSKEVFELFDSDTETHRNLYNINRNIIKGAREFYDKHKHDENASLIWTDWDKNKL